MDMHFYGHHSSIIHSFMDIRLDILEFLCISMHWLAMLSQSKAVVLLLILQV